MYRMRRGCLIAGFLVWIALGSRPSEAQYTADFQTNIISGVTSNWPGTYYVGNTNFADVLLIQNSGVLADGDSYVGYRVSSSNNTVVVTGFGSVWSNGNFLQIGSSGAGNSLVISDGGLVVNYEGLLGLGSSSSNNHVLVTGFGSVWSNGSTLAIGYGGAVNSLVISNGGRVIVNSDADVGRNSSSSNNIVEVDGVDSVLSNRGGFFLGDGGSGNSLRITDGGRVSSGPVGNGSSVAHNNNIVLISGAGSVWNDSNPQLFFGSFGTGNSMVISNGGQLVDERCSVGYFNGSSNTVRVVDGGVWQNGALIVGDQGSSNSVAVTGGSVYATNLVVGAASTTCDNVLQVNESFQLFGGNRVVVTNALHNAVLEVRHGELILNGGVLQVDTLVITNSCAQFVHAGGTLIASNVVLDPNTFRIVSVVPQSNDMLITWMMGPGAINSLQVASGSANGSYTTNGFTDIFVVTNNASLGTVTNYIDVGAATNAPARFYRARLVL